MQSSARNVCVLAYYINSIIVYNKGTETYKELVNKCYRYTYTRNEQQAFCSAKALKIFCFSRRLLPQQLANSPDSIKKTACEQQAMKSQ